MSLIDFGMKSPVISQTILDRVSHLERSCCVVKDSERVVATGIDSSHNELI